MTTQAVPSPNPGAAGLPAGPNGAPVSDPSAGAFAALLAGLVPGPAAVQPAAPPTQGMPAEGSAGAIVRFAPPAVSAGRAPGAATSPAPLPVPGAAGATGAIGPVGAVLEGVGSAAARSLPPGSGLAGLDGRIAGFAETGGRGPAASFELPLPAQPGETATMRGGPAGVAVTPALAGGSAPATPMSVTGPRGAVALPAAAGPSGGGGGPQATGLPAPFWTGLDGDAGHVDGGLDGMREIGEPAPEPPARAATDPVPGRPLPVRAAAAQVAVQIGRAAADGVDRLVVQLQPAELGRVEVRLDFGEEGRVSALITAERAETLEALQRQAGALEKSLQDAGLRTDTGSLSFSLRQGHERRERDGAAPGTAAGEGRAPGGTADAPPGTLGRHLIDIHA